MVGESLGLNVGDELGLEVGLRVGEVVGAVLGDKVGSFVGDPVGDPVGALVGDKVGASEQIVSSRAIIPSQNSCSTCLSGCKSRFTWFPAFFQSEA